MLWKSHADSVLTGEKDPLTVREENVVGVETPDRAEAGENPHSPEVTFLDANGKHRTISTKYLSARVRKNSLREPTFSKMVELSVNALSPIQRVFRVNPKTFKYASFFTTILFAP